MEQLDKLLTLREEIFAYFGYVEDWRVLPFDDAREYFWRVDESSGTVTFAEEPETLDSEDGEYYENTIYTNRHIPKWVYRGADYTMICVDTHTDGNQFLQIFCNAKERP